MGLIICCLLLIVRFNIKQASFCGRSSIPFSFEAKLNGQPVLGCTRPSCFGWTVDGKPISRDSQFYRVLGAPDGFHRKGIQKPRRINHYNSYFYKEQVATCEKTFESESCLRSDQWVGGISPMYSPNILPLILQCCTYTFLRNSSTERGVAVVNPGQIVVGGEILKNGRQYAFDYIADILNLNDQDGSVSYDVTIRRFMCIPIPDELSVPIDETVISQIREEFGGENMNLLVGKREGLNNVVYQAPLHEIKEGKVRQFTAPPQQEELQLPIPQPNTGLIQSNCCPENQEGFEINCCYDNQQSDSSLYCFSGDMIVHTYDGQDISLRNVEQNDWILTKYMNEASHHIYITYAQITSWIHRLPEKETEFYAIILEDNTQLKLTAKHYIYKTTCDHKTDQKIIVDTTHNEAVWAQNIVVGDCLFKVRNQKNDPYFVKVKVTKIERVREKGIYAPMTSTGDIIVNGIYASCHTLLDNYFIQSSFFEGLEGITDWLQWLIGWEKSPLQKDIPSGMDIIIQMLDLILPSNFYSFNR